jgi:hypothetical protein
MKVIRYHGDEGSRTGLLVETGSKYHHVIMVDNPIRMIKVPLSEERNFTDLDYPVARCKRKLRDMARAWHGSLKNVSRPVREALK